MGATGRIVAAAISVIAAILVTGAVSSPKEVSFPTADGGVVDADLYGHCAGGVVLAHGAAFDKRSWAPLANRIAALGYCALAIDFRGYGESHGGNRPGGLDEDVLAAVRWLHAQGVKSVSVIGGSMGGGAAADAATKVRRGEIDKLILLSPVPIDDPENIKTGSVLFIASRDERLASAIRLQYDRAPQPKKLILLDGSAHAQNIFATAQSAHLTTIILQFLAGRKIE